MQWSLLSKYRLQIMGFATIFVVCFHFYESVEGFNILLTPLLMKGIYFFGTHGNLGVEIFLILSGIGCCFSFSKNSNIILFYKKRLLRILLSYCMIAIPYWIFDTFVLKAGTLSEFFMNFLGISFFTDGVTRFWYVFFILAMYFLFPFIYSLFNNSDNKLFCLLLMEIITCCIIVLLSIIMGKRFVMYEVMLTRIPVFLLGVYIGFSMFSKKEVSTFFLTLCFIAFLSLFVRIEYSTFLVKRFVAIFQSLGIIFVFIKFYIFVQNQLFDSILNWFGTRSLEIYLIHIALRRILLDLNILQENAYYYIYIICISLVISCIIQKICDTINKKIMIKLI